MDFMELAKNRYGEMKNPPGFQWLVVPDGSSAHPAGFEPTACRLGDENRAFLLYPSNARKRLLLLHF